MVKNITGGNKHKCQARKNITNNYSASKLRIIEEDGEMYCKVVKILGGGICQVSGIIDNIERLCIIRGKFKGKGKRDNIIKIGSLVLIGLREWESEKQYSKGKTLSKCDLLCVYSESDVSRLKKTILDVNWDLFENETNKNIIDDFEFSNDTTNEDYIQLIEETIKNENKKISLSVINENYNKDDEIDIDDI